MKKMFIAMILITLIITGFFLFNHSFAKEEVVNITIEKYCENGTPENGKCKVITSVSGEVGCPDDYPLNEESKYCERVVSLIAEQFRTCDPGFKATSGKCISEESFPKDENGRCAEGHTMLNGECKEIRYQFYGYSCPSGVLNETTHKCDFVDQKTPSLVCPEGYIVNQSNLTCDTISYEEPKEREVREEVTQ